MHRDWVPEPQNCWISMALARSCQALGFDLGLIVGRASDTHYQLLEAGRAALADRGPCSPVRSIRLTDALRRLHLSVGAAYRIWPCQDDYYTELDHWVARHDLEAFEKALGNLDRCGIEELVAVFALTFSEAYPGQCAVAAEDPVLAEVISRRNDQLDAAIRRGVATALGNTDIEETEINGMTAIVRVLFDGFALQLARSHDRDTRVGLARSFAQQLRTVVHAFSTP